MMNVFILSRFASSANQRISHLLSLKDAGLKTILVRQIHDRSDRQIQHDNVIDFSLRQGGPYVLNVALALAAAADLGTLAAFPLSTSAYLGALKRRLFKTLRQAGRRGEASMVILVVPPPELVVLARTIKRRFPAVSVVIDWQDLWSPDDYYIDQGGKGYRRIVALERRALDAADVNITTNPKALAAQMRLAGPSTGAESGRFQAIGHAFEGERAPLRPPPRGETGRPRRLVFLGSLFKPPKVPGDLLIAELEKARASGVDLELTVIGDHYLDTYPEAAARLPPFVKVVSRTSHEEAVRHLAGADWVVLLLADLPNTRVIMHAKLGPYLASGTPILAMVPDDSYVAEVIRSCKVGVVVPPHEGAGQAIREALLNPPAQALAADDAAIGAFELPAFQKRWRQVIAQVQSGARS